MTKKKKLTKRQGEILKMIKGTRDIHDDIYFAGTNEKAQALALKLDVIDQKLNLVLWELT